MEAGTGYVLAFTTGFLGGFGHCMGMCGPVVASFSLPARPGRLLFAVAAGQLIFNAGRITTYSFIGAMAGLTGSFVNTAGSLAGLQDIVSVLAGLFMVWMGLGIAGLIRSASLVEGRGGHILNGVKAVAQGEGIWRFYPIGLLLGFLPCGLSYSVFIGSAGAGGLFQGMLFSLLFGLGTLPAMLLVGSLAAVAGRRVRGVIYRMSGVVVVILGLLFIARGFGLPLSLPGLLSYAQTYVTM